jgi:hypothetical protein
MGWGRTVCSFHRDEFVSLIPAENITSKISRVSIASKGVTQGPILDLVLNSTYLLVAWKFWTMDLYSVPIHHAMQHGSPDGCGGHYDGSIKVD